MTEKNCSNLKNIPTYDEFDRIVVGDTNEDFLASMNPFTCNITKDSCIAYCLPEEYQDQLSPRAAVACIRGENTYHDEIAKSSCKAYNCSEKEFKQLEENMNKARKLKKDLLTEIKSLYSNIPSNRFSGQISLLEKNIS